LLLAFFAQGPLLVVRDAAFSQREGVRVTNQVQVHESKVLSDSEGCAVPPSYEAKAAANSFRPIPLA
jgi:hypothetical protein